MPGAFSIRTALQYELHNFANISGLECPETEELIRDLVSLLASYREEGHPLFPDVYILRKPADLLTLAPGANPHVIGSIQYENDTAARILKNTAGLAGGGWSIYAGKSESGKFDFGVFRSQRHSFATSSEESMCDLGAEHPIILIRNRGHLTVELLNSSGASLTVSLTASQPTPSVFSQYITTLVGQSCSEIDDEPRQQFSNYLARTLTGLLQQCHGTLIAVIDANLDGIPDEMSDGVWLSPSIDLFGCHMRAVKSGDAASLADLQAAECLLRGMVNSDGIVILDTKGCVRAFRVFLAPTNTEKQKLDDSGGGRRRTFNLMKLRVESNQILAALIRSQDGVMDCKGTENA